MRRMSPATYLWPGLPQLWYEGAWSALALAIGFGLLLNLLLAVTFVWIELLTPPLLTVGWLALGVLWLLSVIGARGAVQRTMEPAQDEAGQDLFRSAQSEYLRGNWFQAEAILLRLLERDPRDAEARLLLATLLRHTKRFKEAREQLACLARFESAERWTEEIEREQGFLSASQTPLIDWLGSIKAPTAIKPSDARQANQQAA
jgi:hypothetical protein